MTLESRRVKNPEFEDNIFYKVIKYNPETKQNLDSLFKGTPIVVGTSGEIEKKGIDYMQYFRDNIDSIKIPVAKTAKPKKDKNPHYTIGGNVMDLGENKPNFQQEAQEFFAQEQDKQEEAKQGINVEF
jgi:hypothetical protein